MFPFEKLRRFYGRDDVDGPAVLSTCVGGRVAVVRLSVPQGVIGQVRNRRSTSEQNPRLNRAKEFHGAFLDWHIYPTTLVITTLKKRKNAPAGTRRPAFSPSLIPEDVRQIRNPTMGLANKFFEKAFVSSKRRGHRARSCPRDVI